MTFSFHTAVYSLGAHLVGEKPWCKSSAYPEPPRRTNLDGL